MPTGTSQISVTLRSPSGTGDSVVWTGLNVGYRCGPSLPLTLNGSVDLQGRPAKPDPSWAIPLSISITPSGKDADPQTWTTSTDENGQFALTLDGITPGFYDIRVKGNHTLRHVAANVSLEAGDNNHFFGTLLEGDVETAETFNQIVQTDVDVFTATFNLCQSDLNFNPNADLNEDGCVTQADFGLLSGNFGKTGDVPVPDLRTGRRQDQAVTVAFAETELTAEIDEAVVLTIGLVPNGTPVNGDTLHLYYDPALVEVLDVTPSRQLPITLAKPFIDHQAGIVRLSEGILGQTIGEPFTVATMTIRLKSATEGTTIAFTTDFPATTVSGPEGLLSTDVTNIRLKTAMKQAENLLYLPAVLK